MLFVAIPLPVTGGWTGSLIAVLLGLSFWKSLLYIFSGVCVASLIVASLTLLGKVGAIIASVILLFLVIISIIKVIIDKNKKKEEI
ncbi:MAG TPA: small multi-drug export, partial [Bacteroidetes bacterium]|nr:small multi-drug export [Bacteroidota bacterium]